MRRDVRVHLLGYCDPEGIRRLGRLRSLRGDVRRGRDGDRRIISLHFSPFILVFFMFLLLLPFVSVLMFVFVFFLLFVSFMRQRLFQKIRH